MATSFEQTQAKLGSRIEQLRRQRNLSQESLADKAQISHAYYWSIIKNGRNITLQTAWKLANALDVSLTELFDF